VVITEYGRAQPPLRSVKELHENLVGGQCDSHNSLIIPGGELRVFKALLQDAVMRILVVSD